jgi:hypothetical protein
MRKLLAGTRRKRFFCLLREFGPKTLTYKRVVLEVAAVDFRKSVVAIQIRLVGLLVSFQ